ncbi:MULTISPECIES: phosphoglycerate kinase [Methylosinus]|uniref:Phosphoglycerate kinase n=1 Tax=Methylosinus trichosporium (strain ATCC 35070 / NCIMB 11131 / UNIQEM 75 / OB3b) TaxID=595536 RepID=A0A2D2D0V2_METT3|nr:MULTISPECIES: phosphoglycerate kinase [Methylosinus]ATQ68499.1 phosphoglycerate kinase [Methylosinus trichosporium OB3b]OBS53968.1 phosphoglycerate kinase [Methylosinus sp. 3S-1]
MAAFNTLDSADLKGKRVLLRVDFNVPMENGVVTDRTRIQRVLPTIEEISAKGGKVILLAHFGRPKGERKEDESLRPVAAALAETLHRPVAFAEDCVGEPAREAIGKLADGDILLLENTRFHKGEEKNDPAFIAEVAKLGDLYVNEAFSAAHRAHATTEGLAHVLPAYAGRTMQAELQALGQALDHPEHPVMAVVGGAKISTKLELLGNLIAKVDALVIGGGMANTFLAAQGKPIGKSLCEHDLLDKARAIMADAKAADCEIVLPVDATVAQKFEAHAPSHIVSVDHVGEADMILDLGPKSVAHIESLLEKTKTLVWNGPLGAFELPPFDEGTNAVAQTAARLTCEGRLLSVAGGGDTVAALNQAHAAQEFTYLSTAGGAFLEWLEGKELPGVAALRK